MGQDTRKGNDKVRDKVDKVYILLADSWTKQTFPKCETGKNKQIPTFPHSKNCKQTNPLPK
jgi:hypothetical protein